MNKRKVLLGLLVGFLVSGTALAAEFAAPEKGGDPNITISAGETRHNLYTAGANVTLNGQMRGDVFAAGGMVSVIGYVEQDLTLAGGSLALSGKIGGDVRLAGGNISISSPIGGDLLIAGGNISITEKASVQGDLVIGGGNVILDAPVRGSLRAAGGNLTINSKIEGDVQIFSSGKRKSEGNVVFGPKAQVLGKITHKGSKAAVVKEGAKVSAIEFIAYARANAARNVFAKLLTVAFVFKLAAWFLAALLLIKFRKHSLQRLAQNMLAKPWENLGLGLGGLVVMPLAVILLLVFLVGYYIAGIVLLSYLLLLMLAGLVGALAFGAWLMKLINKSETLSFDWKTALMGIVVLGVLAFVPILGGLVCFVVFLAALGALLREVRQKLNSES